MFLSAIGIQLSGGIAVLGRGGGEGDALRTGIGNAWLSDFPRFRPPDGMRFCVGGTGAGERDARRGDETTTGVVRIGTDGVGACNLVSRRTVS